MCQSFDVGKNGPRWLSRPTGVLQLAAPALLLELRQIVSILKTVPTCACETEYFFKAATDHIGTISIVAPAMLIIFLFVDRCLCLCWVTNQDH